MLTLKSWELFQTHKMKSNNTGENSMIRKLLKIPIGLTAFIISFIGIVLPWNIRFIYTMKVCSRLQSFAERSKLLGSLIKSTVEDHGMDMGGKIE